MASKATSFARAPGRLGDALRTLKQGLKSVDTLILGNLKRGLKFEPTDHSGCMNRTRAGEDNIREEAKLA